MTVSGRAGSQADTGSGSRRAGRDRLAAVSSSRVRSQAMLSIAYQVISADLLRSVKTEQLEGKFRKI